MTSSRPAVLLKSDIIPADTLASLDRGDLTLSQLIAALGMPHSAKNRVYRSIALHVRAGLAPASLLRYESIRQPYERNPHVVTPDLEAAPGPSDREIDRARREALKARTRAREAELEVEDLRRVSEVLAGLHDEPVSPPAWLDEDYIPHLDAPSVPILMMADWHLGEVVDPSQSYGYTYNVQIAEARIKETVERSVRLLRHSIAGTTYPGIVLACVGDLVSGSIHGELAETDELEILPSIIRARDLMVGVIDTMKREFGRVFVPTAVGNHGRVFDKRPRAKGYVERNADHMVYKLLESHYRDDPDVTISAQKSGETLFRIYGMTFLLTHGDQIGAKGGDGLIGSIGPIMRGQMKTLRSLATLDIEVDHILMGHYHQQLYLPRVTVSGCLKGPDEYAIRLLRAPVEDPSQTLLLVHPEYGVTFRQPLFLRDQWCPDRTTQATDKRWVSVFGDAA
ncbi:hypothetical protein [Cereibacter azotoformans]|uniref:Calcineurin-like phosphoesterase domain-containing protein n=1 Tax=Cereibacter azotoformans TaxID=43057 RepID=A0A2T5K6Z9_9RHOB|nr:hypothetical protein [Cereibacter azotoformans]MBO4169530.1 hypothetical protein [Cereibacter azotoformans]PTR18207.1 hypothetical protein C8J28_109167 [Cereibacter azotoformans]